MTNKSSYSAAHKVASLVQNRLAPHCRRIEIAGSLRRQRPQVGDIELVAIPKTYYGPPTTLDEQLVGRGPQRNQLHEYLDELLGQEKIALHLSASGVKCWGERLRKFTVTTKGGISYKVDLFMCDESDWANTFVIRTGSAEFSHWLVTPRAQGGAMPNDMRHTSNRLWRNEAPVACDSEEEFFSALGLPYIPPQLRQDNLWFPFMEVGAAQSASASV